MILEGNILVFFGGFMGGCVNEILHWWNLRTDERLPKYAKSLKYWILTLFMAFLGGGICWLYFGEKVEGLLAIQVGLSTPLILQKFASSIPKTIGAKGRRGEEATIQDFLKW